MKTHETSRPCLALKCMGKPKRLLAAKDFCHAPLYGGAPLVVAHLTRLIIEGTGFIHEDLDCVEYFAGQQAVSSTPVYRVRDDF